MVVNVSFIRNYGLCVEGEVVHIAVTCSVGAPVVLVVVPLKIGLSSGVIYKEGIIALCGESPALVCALNVKRGVGVCKSDNVAGKRGKGIAVVSVNRNNEDLSVGYVAEIICGVVNAYVVESGLYGRKKLAVSSRTDKNAIAVLKLGNESPSQSGSALAVISAASALAVDERMSVCLDLICLVGISASAGVGGITVFGAGGSGNYALVCMAVCLNLVCLVGVAASAGVGGITVFSAGGSGNYALVCMAVCLDLICLVGISASAGVGGVAIFSTGGSGNCALVLVSKSLSLCFAALTGCGLRACCFAEYVIVNAVCSRIRGLAHIIFRFARSKAENGHSKHKHDQHN